MKSFSMYALKEPDTGEIRYFGKTCQKVQRRFGSHLRSKQETHVSRWVRALKRDAKMPVCEVLLLGLENWEASEEEKALIAWGRASGLRLTNLTDGGDGGLGRPISAEQRAAISLRTVGKKYALGSKRTPEQQAATDRWTPEQRAAASLRMAGNNRSAGHRWTPEQRADISIRMTGIWKKRKGIPLTQQSKEVPVE